MNFKSKNVITLFTALSVCFVACLSIGSDDVEKVKEERPVVSSLTVNPEIPNKVFFCGDTIDLTSYDMYERFDRELTSFTYFHSTTLLLIKRANRYFPIIEPILAANGIPDDFKYLAVIESNLDPNIVSPARAAGMWQLMEATARERGLVVHSTIDERRHVQKSTEAACHYLNEAYRRYGNWVNVAAAYNAGMGRISGELTKQYCDSAFDLWVVEETSRYVFRIMAIKQIFENPYRYGFVIRPQDLYKPQSVKEVSVSSDIQDLAKFAQEQGVTYSDLKRFNLWLRDRKLVTGGKKYKIDIPNKEEFSYDTPNSVVHDSRWVVK
jgi:Soluble lytic murein transglycosylase and related regulatory proteins (some contain LysM/invasin domains)